MGLVSGAFRLAVIAAASIWLAGCQTAAVGPDRPGTRVRPKVPDPQKWVGNQNSFGDRRVVFRCRPLACPEASVVSVRSFPSPTRSPDPQALQKFAQEHAEKQMAQAEQSSSESGNKVRDLALLTSRVGKAKDYPAIHWEYRGTSAADKTIYVVHELVFAGNSAIDVVSISPTLEVARRNGVDFIGALEIEDFAPPVR